MLQIRGSSTPLKVQFNIYQHVTGCHPIWGTEELRPRLSLLCLTQKEVQKSNDFKVGYTQHLQRGFLM